MNQDLLKPEVKAHIIARINKLTPTSTAVWGKMNVSQMLAHCQAQMLVALGDIKLPHTLMGKIFGSWARRKVLEEKPYSHGLPTSPAFIIKTNPDFEETKNNLINVLTRFNENSITKEPHPFFGKMSVEEWSAATWKHLDHHLRQFGA